MGVDTTFYAIIGVFVTQKDLLKNVPMVEIRRPSCVHTDTQRAGKYCCECGRLVEEYTDVCYDPKVMSKFQEYINHHVVCTPIQDDLTGENIGYILGRRRTISPNDIYNRSSMPVQPVNLDAILLEVNEFLDRSDCPIKNNLVFTVKDFKVHAYMDER